MRKKVLTFRWDAVEKRPARGRVYIRAKRGDALTTSPRCFDFLVRFSNGQKMCTSRLSIFSMWVMFMVEQNCLPTVWNVTCSIQVSNFAVPGEGSNHPFPGTAHTCCLCGWSFSASIHCCKSPVHMGSNVPPFCMGGLGSEPDLCARLFAQVWRKKKTPRGKNKKRKVKSKTAKYGWRVCVRGRMCCERFRWALHVVGVRGDLLSSVDF